ncbi:hypothetical protein ACIBK9_11865 [Nonomuraea sp. NPDC050227]
MRLADGQIASPTSRPRRAQAPSAFVNMLMLQDVPADAHGEAGLNV